MRTRDENASLKRRLRRAMRERRRQTSEAEHRRASRDAADRLRPLLADADAIAVFAAHDHEIALDELYREWLAAGRKLAFPRVVGPGDMVFALVDDLADLRPGAYGILEPPGPPIDLAAVHTVLVPGIAFDRRGRRLGFGGGYYDRALQPLVKTHNFLPFLIGVGYSWQLLDSQLPFEPWDVVVHCVVTDDEVWDVPDEGHQQGEDR